MSLQTLNPKLGEMLTLSSWSLFCRHFWVTRMQCELSIGQNSLWALFRRTHPTWNVLVMPLFFIWIFLHKISLGLEPRALEVFGLFFLWASLSLVPFTFMAWLLVKELVVLLKPGFFTRPTFEKPSIFMMASDREDGQFSSSLHLAQVGSPITNWHTRSSSCMCWISSMSSE